MFSEEWFDLDDLCARAGLISCQTHHLLENHILLFNEILKDKEGRNKILNIPAVRELAEIIIER